MSTPDPEPVDPNHLRPGPIRNVSLPPDLLEHVRAVYDVIGPYLGTTLEQFEIDFTQDANPADEVAVWCSITAAWINYHEQHLGGDFLADEDETNLLGALIAISTGAHLGGEDEDALGVPADVARKLLACYDALGEEPG